MKIKCMICDQIIEIDEDSLLAKRMRNKPLTSYLCTGCHDRIAENTKAHFPQKEETAFVEELVDPIKV